ncbi:NUDIX hydrolase [Saprospira grandis]|uniref:NUDIX hydrolase n=1 Tax=Saprospira grandis TaxID=1008 RepID=UPI0022DDA252|nr:NUDIX domain-containing protein [Saprospira grandis]WBM73422.1 NUDIX domain-containing protein [Saprospira grandis]
MYTIFHGPHHIQLLEGPQIWKAEQIRALLLSFESASTPQKRLIPAKGLEALWKNVLAQFHYLEAAGGLVHHQEDVLAIYRFNRWDLPKGKIEKGESPEQAALREVEEETGLAALELGPKLPSTYHIYWNPYKSLWSLKKTHWFQMKALANGPLMPQTEEGIEELAWRPLQAMKTEANTYASIAELLKSC